MEVSSGLTTNDTVVITWCDHFNLDQYNVTFTADLFLEDMHLERRSGLRVVSYNKSDLVVAGRYTFWVFAVESNERGYSARTTFLAGPGKHATMKGKGNKLL